MPTKEEKEMVIEKYLFYIQFNFHQITMNRIGWDTGLKDDEILTVIKEHGIKVDNDV